MVEEVWRGTDGWSEFLLVSRGLVGGGLLMDAVEVKVAVGVATLATTLLPLFTLLLDGAWRSRYQVLALIEREAQSQDRPLAVVNPLGHSVVHPPAYPTNLPFTLLFLS